MWTQRDQLQAYQFLRRRLVSALQVADANHPVSPSRRVIACGIIGAVVMLLIAAGFGIYGLLRPGANSNWRKPGQVVIEKESGAPYVLLDDGRLHPVLNYTSARLLVGGNGTARVSAKSLRGAPRGAPVGIPGAPETPPPLADLLAGPWTVCSQTSPDRPAADPATTVLTLGVMTAGQVPGPSTALLVRQGNTIHVLVAGRRMKVVDAKVLLALGMDEIAPTAVTTAWINTVPAGPDLKLLAVPSAGQNGKRVGNTTPRVGQVLLVEHVNTPPRYYVVLADGVAPISQMQAVLVYGDARNKAAYPEGPARAVKVGASDIAAADKSRRDLHWPDYPQQVPQGRELDRHQVAMCATALAGGAAVIHHAPAVPMPAGSKETDLTGDDDPRVADEAYIPPGRGAIVVEQRPSGTVVGTEYLVTDQGIRFPLGGKEARKALGLERAPRVGVPASVLALLPVGPLLDKRAAGHVITFDGAGPSATAGEPERR